MALNLAEERIEAVKEKAILKASSYSLLCSSAVSSFLFVAGDPGDIHEDVCHDPNLALVSQVS